VFARVETFQPCLIFANKALKLPPLG